MLVSHGTLTKQLEVVFAIAEFAGLFWPYPVQVLGLGDIFVGYDLILCYRRVLLEFISGRGTP